MTKTQFEEAKSFTMKEVAALTGKSIVWIWQLINRGVLAARSGQATKNRTGITISKRSLPGLMRTLRLEKLNFDRK